MKINFENRFMGDNGSLAKISLDGTDCPIQEPRPFNDKYFSAKFGKAGLKYEIGICIQTGWIVWYNGPFPAGASEKTIAKIGVIRKILPDEKILVDSGFVGCHPCMILPSGIHGISQRMKSLCRARHETVNGRIKTFSVMSSRFRHDIKKHESCFLAVLTVTQIHIMNYGTNFTCYYQEELNNEEED
jgi:hypothetical protein